MIFTNKNVLKTRIQKQHTLCYTVSNYHVRNSDSGRGKKLKRRRNCKLKGEWKGLSGRVRGNIQNEVVGNFNDNDHKKETYRSRGNVMGRDFYSSFRIEVNNGFIITLDIKINV